MLWTSSSYALQPRWTPPKPASISFINPAHFNRNCINVKFVEGSMVRLRNREFISLSGRNLDLVGKALAGFKVEQILRLIDLPEEKLETYRLRGERRSGKQLADLNNWYRIILDSTQAPEPVIETLLRLEIVEDAHANPIPAMPEDIDPETADFTASQGYLYDPPEGIGAPAVWELEGGLGAGIKIIDIEGSWAFNHEDLKDPFYLVNDERNNTRHGDAVVGILIAQHNGYGVNGICPDAEIGGHSVYLDNRQWPNVSSEMTEVVDHLDEGDIFLVELQFLFEEHYSPVETWQENFDVIETATANGIICCEAAGNGDSDLDANLYEGRFNPDNRHSGAILVGAGDPPVGDFGPDRGRCAFSNYGQRVDLQGWGREVTTTGYGDLFFPNNDHRQWYAGHFSGTSSATPIVAGAAACIQGIYKARMNGHTLSGLAIRNMLVETGSPQNFVDGLEGHIGPRPNLTAVVARIPAAPVWDDPPDSIVVSEMEQVHIILNAFDLNNDSLSLTSIENTLPFGSDFMDRGGGLGIFRWTPDFSSAGEYTPIFVVSDGDLTDTAVVHITVNNVNRPPIFYFENLEPPDSAAMPEGDTIRFVWSSATDPDDDRIIYTLLLEGYRDHFYFNAGSDTTREVRRRDLLILMGDSSQAVNWRVMATFDDDTFYTNHTFTLLPPLEVREAPLSAFSFQLYEAFPNPFNSTVTITFSVGQVSKSVKLAIYDLSGRLVADLLAGRMPAPREGEHKVIWDASSLGAGVYFVRLEAGEQSVFKKVVLVR